MPTAPLALVEVQGYVYAALRGAAELAAHVDLGHDATDLLRRANSLKDRFNEAFWDRRGWFVLGLDADHRPIDALTTNPGHALWSGIADDDKARQYVERLADPDLWTGWGLRTLAGSMAAYDPLSYHNGSVWPHDTALSIAGAARYGHWDVVDLLVDGALEATRHFDGRPPELFAGLSRNDVAMPVPYPSSCSPQAWASASVLLLVRAMLGLEPTADRSGVQLLRGDLSACRTSRSRAWSSPGGRCPCTSSTAAAGSCRVGRAATRRDDAPLGCGGSLVRRRRHVVLPPRVTPAAATWRPGP